MNTTYNLNLSLVSVWLTNRFFYLTLHFCYIQIAQSLKKSLIISQFAIWSRKETASWRGNMIRLVSRNCVAGTWHSFLFNQTKDKQIKKKRTALNLRLAHFVTLYGSTDSVLLLRYSPLWQNLGQIYTWMLLWSTHKMMQIGDRPWDHSKLPTKSQMI